MNCFFTHFLSINWSGWLSALTTTGIFILAVYQYKESKALGAIQKSLSLIDLIPSIDLDFNFTEGRLLIKNTGRTQIYFISSVVNVYGVTPDFSDVPPEGRRIIAINSSFPMRFDIEINRSFYEIDIPKDMIIYGKIAIITLQNTKYEIDFTIKYTVVYNDETPKLLSQGAWIENMQEIKKFKWE